MQSSPPDSSSPGSRYLKFVCAGACLSRPTNLVITFSAVLLGGWLEAGFVSDVLLWAGLSAALIAGGGNVLNDLLDVEGDRRSHPDRPLPSGTVPRWLAAGLSPVLSLVGLAAAYGLPEPCLQVALGVVVGLLVYNISLKRKPLIGNLVVAGLGGLPFLFGGLATGSVGISALPASFAAVFHLGREIVKDIQDLDGDRLHQARTLPVWIGEAPALWIATVIFSVLILSVPVPAFVGLTGGIYLAIVLALDGVLIYVLRVLWSSSESSRYERASSLLKKGMLLGLAAFFLDRL